MKIYDSIYHASHPPDSRPPDARNARRVSQRRTNSQKYPGNVFAVVVANNVVIIVVVVEFRDAIDTIDVPHSERQSQGMCAPRNGCVRTFSDATSSKARRNPTNSLEWALSRSSAHIRSVCRFGWANMA